MRSHALAGWLLAVTTACTVRAHPYRFASPMLGTADVPDHSFPRAVRNPAVRNPAVRNPAVRNPDMTAAPIRVASADAADAVLSEPAAHAVVWSRLPAPHRAAAESRVAVARPADLRSLVGVREKRDAFAVTLEWAHDLGSRADAASGPELVAWAEANGHAAPPTDDVAPGDLLVFDRTEGDGAADLVAIAISRDDRGVIDFIYVAGGVVRRGFVDPRRPATRRDSSGAILNTFLRAGKRWPPKGTHYLSGELLSHVIRAR